MAVGVVADPFVVALALLVLHQYLLVAVTPASVVADHYPVDTDCDP